MNYSALEQRHRHAPKSRGPFSEIATFLASLSFALADYFEDPDSALFISQIAYATLLVFLLSIAGIMSGLTLALFTLDVRTLKAYANGSCERQKRHAIRVLPLLERPHWTLCTLLVCNAAAVETLPLVLDHIVQAFAAVVLSVILVLVFGEILPQAFFAKYALTVSSFFAGFVGFLMVITGPVSWPIAKGLDILVGHKPQSLLRRTELKQLLRLQRKHSKHSTSHRAVDTQNATKPATLSENSSLLDPQSRNLLQIAKRWTADHFSPSTGTLRISTHSDSSDDGVRVGDDKFGSSLQLEDNEMKIMLGALSLSELKVSDVMPAKSTNIFFLEKNEEITKDLVAAVFNHGFSRIPVFCAEKKRFVSYFLARSLISFIFSSTPKAPSMADIFRRKRERLRLIVSSESSDDWMATQPTVVWDLPQHEALYCSTDTVLGEVYEDLITLHTPLVIVLKAEETSPLDTEHTGVFNYGTIKSPEHESLNFSVMLARQKCTVAEPSFQQVPFSPLTYTSRANGVHFPPESSSAGQTPLGVSPVAEEVSSTSPVTKDLPQLRNFQQPYIHQVEEGPTAGMLTFEDVVEVVHGISVVDEFDWESAGRIQSEWRKRLAIARAIQKGTVHYKPSGELSNQDRTTDENLSKESRRLVRNFGLDTTTRGSNQNYSFGRPRTDSKK